MISANGRENPPPRCRTIPGLCDGWRGRAGKFLAARRLPNFKAGTGGLRPDSGDADARGDTEAVLCAPGGVISLLMAALALPRLDMKAWSADSGAGFLVRVTPTLWMREPVMEFMCQVP